ncbi:DUF3892 domain-containing protein [Paenibacillus medicaginis]|uniref:DUF3892 domain-containing protein n=1 Tax=Paenibacillus medicaginis TaxID=1470560 RepID=A0ABV5C0J1_9BACL
MESKIIAVRVEHPGTHERHIVRFRLESGSEMEKEAMVAFLLFNPNTFYTYADGKKAYVMVAFTEAGKPYVKTKADDTTANNLLSLPRF